MSPPGPQSIRLHHRGKRRRHSPLSQIHIERELSRWNDVDYVEIWRLVFRTENYEVAMWVKNLALDNLMKASFGPDIDTIYSCPMKIDELLRLYVLSLSKRPPSGRQREVRSPLHTGGLKPNLPA